MMEYTCTNCGKSFIAENYRVRKYCSMHCRNEHIARKPQSCLVCGRTFMPKQSGKVCCSNTCGSRYAAMIRSTTQGFCITSKGYRMLCQPEHPMASKAGYVMEHRLLMAQKLQRPLLRAEVVHHVNHNPQDNRIENLQLFDSNKAHKIAESARSAVA